MVSYGNRAEKREAESGNREPTGNVATTIVLPDLPLEIQRVLGGDKNFNCN